MVEESLSRKQYLAFLKGRGGKMVVIWIVACAYR